MLSASLVRSTVGFAIPLLTFLLYQPLHAREVTIRIAGNRAKSHVPAWDIRGIGPLPWQGIACADLTPDGRFIALGTIAPAGDPQLFVLDEHGNIVAQHRAGERWVNEVAISPDGALLTALVSTPEGTAGDIPRLIRFTNGKQSAQNNIDAPLGYNDLFHYGSHSNHLPAVLRSTGTNVIVAGQGQASWASGGPDFAVQRAFFNANMTIAMAASPAGQLVIGSAVSTKERSEGSKNLTVLDPGGKVRWQRAVSDDVAPAPAMEHGVFGASVLPFQDVKAWAPLSVAISTDGSLVAAADYQGWHRYFDRGIDYSSRFMPAKPVIQVYTADGAPVRRFAPETFAVPGWYDLAFTADKKLLLAYPHSWTSRGLGGQPRLPVDDDARTLYALDLASGDSTRVDFPDAIAGVALGSNGTIAVSCWDGNIYLRGADLKPIGGIADRLAVGVPCVLRMSQDGGKLLAAGADGTVRLFDAGGKLSWQADLNKLATPGDKPWTKNQRLGQIAPGLWMKGGMRTHSDMGGQYIIEAPDGLLLIDPNAGLSIEQNLAQIKGAGLDPMRVKYVLLTHEHGDHAPGAYLWRLLTGAQVVSCPEMAYTLQHHLWIGTGYGFHPPQPIDILVDHDQELTLAGLKVRVVYLSGHTYGSLGYIFEKDGKRYAALGDMIMPGGNLGSAGHVNFSANDVMGSLRKLREAKPDFILGGHGHGDPADFIDKGILAGEATGWGWMTPEKPDPLFKFTQRNYLVLDWLQPISAAAYGDVDGDGKPDVAVVVREKNGVTLHVFLNKGGKFAAVPDIVQPVPKFFPDVMTKLRLLHVGTGKQADFFLGAERQAVLLMAQEGQPAYRIVELPGIPRLTQAMVGDFNGDGRNDLLLGGRAINRYDYAIQGADGSFRMTEGGPTKSGFDMQLLDVNDDKLDDLITSAGEIFLRQPDGKFPPQPSFQLDIADSWTYMATADFNNDGQPDIALINCDNAGVHVAMHYHTGDPKQPYTTKPTTVLLLPDAYMLRDGPTIADWNGDGIPDLVLTGGGGAMILLGSTQGLDPTRMERVKLDYNPYYDNRLGVADFTGSGKMSLAGWGSMSTGAVGLYIWTR